MTTIINAYRPLAEFAKAFAEGRLNFLLVLGRGGLAKTTTIRMATEGSAKVIQGQVSAIALYMELYRHRDQPIVIDDVDRLYADPACVRLLKLVCQTERTKLVEWNTTTKLLDAENIPRQFTTSSPVCIIANDFRASNPNTKALIDRGVSVRFDPSADEVHDNVRSWFDDAEVFSFIGEHLGMISEPSQRHYFVAKELHEAGLDWQGALLSTWGVDPRIVALRQVYANEELGTQGERCGAWMTKTGADRATFYRLSKEHPEIATLREYTRSNRRRDQPSPRSSETTRRKRDPQRPVKSEPSEAVNRTEVAS